MSTAQLLAIVEVPHDDRVCCQSAGCNHPVFRRIHVVRENSVVRVYGSECFKKLFFGLPVVSSKPQYTTPEGRLLTDEERKLLIENTERLIQLFESEYQSELARQAALVATRPTPAQSLLHLPPNPSVADGSAVQQVSGAQPYRAKNLRTYSLDAYDRVGDLFYKKHKRYPTVDECLELWPHLWRKP